MNYLTTNQSKIRIIRWQISLKIVKCDITSRSQSPCQWPSLSTRSVCCLDLTDHHPALPSLSTKEQQDDYEIWNTHVGHQTHQDFIKCGRCIRFTSVYITSTFSSADEGSERNSRAFDGGGWSTSPSFCLCSKWLPFLMKESSASIITSFQSGTAP